MTGRNVLILRECAVVSRKGAEAMEELSCSGETLRRRPE